MSEWIRVTDHAADRWHERTDTPGVGPIVAWNKSERRDITDLDADEIRYHQATEMLLLRRDEALVTVIDASTARPKIQQDIYGDAQPPMLSS